MKKNKKMVLVLIGLIFMFGLTGCSKDDLDKNDVDGIATEDIQNEEAEIDPINKLIDSSEYISKIKLIRKSADTSEVKILDNIKGNLSYNDLPVIDGLVMDQTYVVFLKNLDNRVVLTDDKEGIILLQGDNHELFEKINKKIHDNK